ncbi:RtcB family protein [Candidatus Micrarchaeota archaeon]|nr:RtcB family protein [Candidatus Micrarchaeota archaeon]
MTYQEISPGMYEVPREGPMRVPVRLVAQAHMLDHILSDRTLQQAKNVAALPGILEASYVMPDGHEGYGFPIGGVAAFDEEEGIVSPGGLGYDLNCGVRFIRTNYSENEIRPHLQRLTDALFKNIPSGVGSKAQIKFTPAELEDVVTQGLDWAVEKGYGRKQDRDHCEENGCFKGADYSKVSDLAKKRGAPQVGTLGSGNHFLEVQKVEKVFDPVIAKAFGVFEGQITMMIHSGSRGFGHQICDDNLRVMLRAAEKYGIPLADPELCCAPLDSKEAEDYLKAMSCAVNYAFCNRQLMTHWVRETFEQVFRKPQDEMGLELVYDVCHNVGKFEEYDIQGKKRNVFVHRKGATRAFWAGHPQVPQAYRAVGQPVIIPGSMNTSSYLLCGLPGAAKTFGSSCHGAGRRMSRHMAIRQFDSRKVEADMVSKGQVIRATQPRLLSEEAGGAYKNVDDVVGAVEKAGISKIVAKMVPLGVVKG